MRYRKEDANGDYSFGGGPADFWVDVPEAVGQAVMTKLRLWAGEWFLDNTEGTPWNTKVLGKYTQETRDAAIRARILQTPGVTDIETYASVFDGNTRSLSVTATINTIYGQTPITGTL
ncbi:hypothetical protein [Silvimonas soli]|uniref:hypothetical protein n=1 Tax=Silvimonas soli TaxID=2980100 RepID=UPI0024B37F32|nr:hypothetical protein [Silvimonas soli]